MDSHSLNLLSGTKHRVGVLRSSKASVFVHLSSKNFFCKKAQTHENLSQVFIEALKK